MDIDALHSALLSMTVISEKIRSARELLPATELNPVDLKKFFFEVERDLMVTKATLAGELGFALCPRCWPPELMTTNRDGNSSCPACGEVTYSRAA